MNGTKPSEPESGIHTIYEYANDDDIIPSRILSVIEDDENVEESD